VSNPVSKATYVNADESTTKALTYDMINGLYEKLAEVNERVEDNRVDCNERLNKLENRKKIDTGVAAGSGLVGGFIAMFIKGIKDIF